MKKYIALLLIIILLLSGCAKAPATEPQQEITPPPAAEPIVPQVAELAPQSYILDYNGISYTSFYSYYGYHYHFDKDMRLIPTGDTVQVDEWITCGTGLPENYDPFAFNGEIFTIENDIYDGEIIFVYNKTQNVYYPFRGGKKIDYNSGDTIKTVIDKQYGSGSFDSITEVRLATYNYTNEWFELPDETEAEILKTVKNMYNSDSSWQCDHKSNEYEHSTLRLVLPITKFEHRLTLCHKNSTINGWEIPRKLCDDIMSCIDTKYHRKVQFSRNKID